MSEPIHTSKQETALLQHMHTQPPTTKEHAAHAHGSYAIHQDLHDDGEEEEQAIFWVSF